MKKSLIILFFVSLVSGLWAQNNTGGIAPLVNQSEDVQLLYRNEQEFGGVIHSSGWGINYRRCKHVTGYKKRILELEMVGMRHPKEYKIQVPDIGTKGFFFGKKNVVTILRGGYGFHKVITGKSDRRGVELRLLTVAGPSFALAKPIYLTIFYADPVDGLPRGYIQYEQFDTNNPKHKPATGGEGIIGRAGYFRGFDEMKFYPGGFFKLGLSFEHSSLDDDIKLLETGIVVDAFYRTVPIMANAKNNQVFINVYLNIMFGKKWF